MQHIPSVPATSDRPQRDWLPAAAYVLLVALLLLIVGLLLWSSLTVNTSRDTAYVNPELRLVERYRAEGLVLFEQAAQLSVNPELKYVNVFRIEPQAAQDFEHANPEVGRQDRRR